MNADQDYWTDRLGNKKPTIDYALRMAGFTPAGFDFTTGGVTRGEMGQWGRGIFLRLYQCVLMGH